MCILQYDGPQGLYSYYLYLCGLVASNPLDLQVIKGVFHLKNRAQDYTTVNNKKKNSKRCRLFMCAGTRRLRRSRHV